MTRILTLKTTAWGAFRSFHSSKHLSATTPALDPQKHEQNQSYIHHIGKHPLVYRNVGQHLRLAAEKYPNNEAIVSCHENKRLTFSEVLEKVDRIAASFYQLGLQKGDRVGIWAPNGTQFYLSTLAAARAGMISVAINPAYQVPEIEYALNKVGVKAIIANESYRTQQYYNMLVQLAPELSSCKPGELKSAKLPSLSTVIINSEQNTQLPGTIKFQNLLEAPSASELSKIESLQAYISPDSGVNIQFTSGTTGHPKAALMSHFGFVNNGIHIGYRNELGHKDHRICVQTPFFHVFGMVIGIVAALNYGTTLVVPGPGFKAAESLEAIVKERCSAIYGTPTMYVDLVRQLRESNLKLPPIDLAVTGGAPCSPKLFTDIQESLGVRQVKTVFGLTESTAVMFQSLFNESKENVLETVGHLMDHYEAKVVDQDGNIVPFGASGELWVRGYGTMLGYWNDDAKTKETIDVDRWLRTGDQFQLRSDGYGKIVGRIKEMVIRGGENIYPKELEDFLITHPKVLETHCVGVPDERMGEEICAYVRLRDASQSLDHAEMKEYCKGKISHFKVPKYLRIVDDFPKTTSGKIQKFKLLESFKSEAK
ncbi:medium-chain acyl-CoA ligase ACSF2, mitochondrial isoform X2 [Topomyia yanbarensis]|uniref:medium-chain acyl-CoA ligase ACSF2, mitochondrial isoform X2 n=1 Tax=Topomyia yanbarensis TaxID=2498891 RepID=UPI00273CB77C|nr:medium-chain acyl-CoA ligase ACSF2, mitochondrial isoform X2 [Topomyia yanbarensis]